MKNNCRIQQFKVGSLSNQRSGHRINKITVNGREINQVQIDEHVLKHKDVTTEVILELVQQLDGVEQVPEDIKPPYEYFVNLLSRSSKQYRLVWLLENEQLYVGVVTAYRDDRRKNNATT